MAALLVLVGAAAPAFLSWAPSTPATSEQAPAGAGASIDRDALAAQVNQLYIADPAEPGVLTVSGDRYAGRFDASGFTLAPRADGAGETFGVSLRSITRGQDVPLVPAGWIGDGNVARRTVADGFTEQVTASKESVEWDVVLDRVPAGAGDLVVEADVSGTPVPATGTAGAMSWSVDGREVSMGEIVVKDAGGQEIYRALPTTTSTGVALTVPGSVLDGADYPVTVDPVISPEYPVDTGDPTSFAPDIAFDGTNYLVVWADIAEVQPWPNPSTVIYGARVSPSGTRLDGSGFPISNGGGSHDRPSVAFDGTNFFVVWSHVETPILPEDDTQMVKAARVSPAGAVLDPNGIVVSAGGALKWAPAVAFDGTNNLVVWEDHRNFPEVDVYAARVSPAGVVQPDFPVSTAVGAQTLPEVASDGTRSLIVWMDGRAGDELDDVDIYGTQVAGTGGPLSPAGVAISSAVQHQGDPSVAWNGNRYLVTWADLRASAGGGSSEDDVYGSRVTAAGVVQDASGIAISTATGNQSTPSVATNGSTFLVAWGDRRNSDYDVYGGRVSDGGVPSDGNGFAISADASWDERPAVTKGPGSTWGVAYEDRADGLNFEPGLISMRTVAPK